MADVESDESKRYVGSAAISNKKNGDGNHQSLFKNYLQLLRQFRHDDLIGFCQRHDELYRAAKLSNDFTSVTKHYYALMASVIAVYYGEGWHFCPPEFEGQSRREATIAMYRKLAGAIELNSEDHSLDIGCGVGGMMRFLAEETGARITGITLGPNEVAEGNKLSARQNLADRCQLVQGDSREMPFENSQFDSAFAVYALKYYPDLDPFFAELSRVLKPGGKFAAYCLCKSRRFDSENKEHTQLLQGFEYSTAMPPLHSVESIIRVAERNEMRCVGDLDLSQNGLPWYSYWVRNPLLPWSVNSAVIRSLTRMAEYTSLLPPGFSRFNELFLAGTLRHIIAAGRAGILTGSALLTFEKAK